MTTMYAAKWAIFDRLVAEAAHGLLSNKGAHGGRLQVLQDNDISQMQTVCLYPGGALFDRDPERTLEDGGTPDHPLWSVHENDTSTWFVRIVAESDQDTRAVEMLATDILDRIAAIVGADRALAGPGSKSYIVAGTGDYSATDPNRKSVVAMVAVRTEVDFQE